MKTRSEVKSAELFISRDVFFGLCLIFMAIFVFLRASFSFRGIRRFPEPTSISQLFYQNLRNKLMAPFHYLGNTSIFHLGWLVKKRDFHKLKQLLKHGKKPKLRLAIAPSEDLAASFDSYSYSSFKHSLD